MVTLKKWPIYYQLTDNEREPAAFTRTHKENSIHVILNNSATKQTAELEELKSRCFVDLLSE